MEQETNVIESMPETTSQEIESQSDSLANDLANDLYPKQDESEPKEKVIEALQDTTDEPQDEEVAEEPEVITKQAPQSWKKEMRETFAKLPPEAQDYIELREKQMAEGIDRNNQDTRLGMAMRDAITPYKAEIARFNMDESTAVKSLLNAQYKLTNGSPEQRMAAYRELGKNLGFAQEEDQGEGQQIDPEIKKLREELYGIKQALTINQQNVTRQQQAKVAQDVEAFASADHPYFDEVADDIAAMIKVGHDLETAYEKAVWANPVTRQKEIARLQTEQEAKLREKAKITADTARKAAGLNVKTRDTSRTPTGPKATMRNLDSVLEESMREIKSRTH